jgi:ubiquinone/menaquinone biosynthesis C-methylase UbiE
MTPKYNYTWEQAVQWLRDQPDQQELVKQCYYDDPLLSAAERFAQSSEWQAVTELLSSYFPAKVLDLGAGRGISSYAFAKAGSEVVALEPDRSDLVGSGAIRSLFASANLPIQIAEEFAETLPFADRTFDIVYGRAVLHHAQDLPKFCQELARVLKPGGVLLATREHVISKKSDLPQFLDSHALHNLYGGENAYLLGEYTDAIQGGGLKVLRVIKPFNSAINYAPMTQAGFKSQTISKLSRLTGAKLAEAIAKIKGFQQLYAWKLSNSDTPGRLYSFLAVKKQ